MGNTRQALSRHDFEFPEPKEVGQRRVPGI